MVMGGLLKGTLKITDSGLFIGILMTRPRLTASDMGRTDTNRPKRVSTWFTMHDERRRMGPARAGVCAVKTRPFFKSFFFETW